MSKRDLHPDPGKDYAADTTQKNYLELGSKQDPALMLKMPTNLEFDQYVNDFEKKQTRPATAKEFGDEFTATPPSHAFTSDMAEAGAAGQSNMSMPWSEKTFGYNPHAYPFLVNALDFSEHTSFGHAMQEAAQDNSLSPETAKLLDSTDDWDDMERGTLYDNQGSRQDDTGAIKENAYKESDEGDLTEKQLKQKARDEVDESVKDGESTSDNSAWGSSTDGLTEAEKLALKKP